MIIIKLTPDENGAYSNQMSDTAIQIPAGWAIVPPNLEANALQYLPFIILTVEDEKIVDIQDNPDKPEPPIPPEPLPDMAEMVASFGKIAAQSLGVAVDLTPKETEIISMAANLPPIADGVQWKAGLNLVEGTIVVFEGANYVVREGQGHISQVGWTPTAVPALFKKLVADYDEWKQPGGAHNAYMQGDKVSHKNKLWISTLNGNVWEPGVYGWEEVI